MRSPAQGEIAALWQRHQAAPWPALQGHNEGELMTLDTVIGGCVIYFLESEDGLDVQRVEILESCARDLADLLPELPDEATEYFLRLSRLAALLLSGSHDP